MWIESELENWDGWNDFLVNSLWGCVLISGMDVFVLVFAIQYNTNPIHNCIYEDAKSETNRQYSDDMENTTRHE